MQIKTAGPLLWGLLSSSAAWAMPSAPQTVCEVYPDASGCQGQAVDCSFCHTTPPARNPFGAALEAALLPDEPRPLSSEQFVTALPEALQAIEADDADGDGASNLEEILAGTLPADSASRPAEAGCPESVADNGWNVCGYDPVYVFKKIHLDVCGRSPSWAEQDEFRQSSNPEQAITAALDRCLDSENWLGKDGVLWRLAHEKIQPVQSIKGGEEGGDIPLGDYFNDYNLFTYTQIDNHDARDLLVAQYSVNRTDGSPTTYSPFTATPRQELQQRGPLSAELVEVERRAGMITSRWFIMSNTMFTSIPRTTAAQAYRAYLGLDIAKMEGLSDVPGEPVDYDNKGVTAPACARCHATLDPLTYPFTRYHGIGGTTSRILPFTYAPNRMQGFEAAEGPMITQTPESGVIFGQEVADLLEWAQVASESEAFARALVLDYWRLLLGQDPFPGDEPEVSQLVQDFMTTHQYGVERMLHDLVQTEAYGVP